MGDLDQLLSPTSQLRVLATSREPLALEGELVVPVGPLAQPDPCDGLGLEDLARVPSVALFVERARAAEPDFALSVENASAVADICTRLHGLPLAIELAAARSSFLTVRAMAARLRERLDVLSSDTQSRPARQQTIEATLAWSYHLLTADEQLVFRRLSVFAGGGTLDAAEAICEVPGILASLASLVRKNLLQMVEQPDGQPRYRMLDLVHLYARDLLRSHAEEAHVRERHAEFFCSLAEVADTQLRSPGHTEWFDRLGWDYDNLRAAMGWADGSGRADLVVRLAGALHPYWSVRGPLTEARAWVQRALASSANETPFARARLASALGTLFWCFREFREATGWHETALALYAEADDTAGQAFSLYNLGIQALQLADPQRAASFLERSTALYARMGDRWGLAGALQGHSWVALQQQDIRRAARLCEQSIAEYRAVGDTRGASGALSNLGEIARQQEQYRRAAALYEQSLEGTRGLGDLAHEALVLGNLGQALLAQGKAHDAAARFRDGLRTAREVHEKRAQAASVAGLGAVACATKRFADAARLLGRAEALVEDLGAPLDLVDRVISERALAQVRQALGEAEADLELSIGRTLSDEDILELGESLATPDSTVSARRDGGLSAREREVAGLVALGYTNQQIADALVISERTANIHVQHILQKLSFNARTQIAAWAVRHQLTPG
jgi:non-specific serine/threonine protein kinase